MLMSKEKQTIEEMAKDLACNICWDEDEIPTINCLETATRLFIKGYRKQSEGEWHYNPDGMDWGLGAWQCSLCGCRNDNLPMDKNIKPLRWAGSKYCPNCGAKMTGGKK